MATRRRAGAAEPVGGAVAASATSTSRSAISRRFVASTHTAVAELLSRDLSKLDVKVLMVDGNTWPTAAAWSPWPSPPTARRSRSGCGTGAMENKTVARALLADLVSRGLNMEIYLVSCAVSSLN